MVLKHKHIDNHLLVTSSAWRNASQVAVGGVGFILNSLAEKSLCEVVSLNKRIFKASFFSVYSPTNVKDNKEESDELYNLLCQAVDDTKLATSWPYSEIGMPNLAPPTSDMRMTNGIMKME
jgi:hypothetical protein